MNPEYRFKSAEKFPLQFDETVINITVSLTEFKHWEDGDFGRPWSIFVAYDSLYLSRRGIPIYKVGFLKAETSVHLSNVYINDRYYNYPIVDDARILLLKILQRSLNREDFYVDPVLELEIIKRLLIEYDPGRKCKKSIGRGNSVALTRHLYSEDNVQMGGNSSGSKELLIAINDQDENEILTSLYLQDDSSGASKTFYFDYNVTRLLGCISTWKTT